MHALTSGDKAARGFRNVDNLIALIYLKCSDLVVPLNNRYQPTLAKSAEKRRIANDLKWKREEIRQETYMMSQFA